MAKKRMKRKKASSKKTVSKSKNLVRSNHRKINLVLKNLVTFVILFVISLVLYMGATKEIYINLFASLLILFGFISVAFLIALLVFVFLKLFKK